MEVLHTTSAGYGWLVGELSREQVTADCRSVEGELPSRR